MRFEWNIRDFRVVRRIDHRDGAVAMADQHLPLLGIDPEEEFYTPEGRPIKIVNNGRVIHDLL